MRIGQHPDKLNPVLKMDAYHRIIIPIYIPHFEDYFRDAEIILNICLNSLFDSVHSKCAITIINNGSCARITQYLRKLKDEGKVDRLIDIPLNKGKIDPLIGEIRATYEPIVTISDADVLFKKSWLFEVENILDKIPKCGMVGHFPDPNKFKGFNATTLLHTLFSAKEINVDFLDELSKFSDSIGETNDKYVLKKVKMYEHNNCEAIIGTHHFSTTMRREYLKEVPFKPSLMKITGNSENHYIDRPMDKMGYLRLSTRKPVVYHMGNVFEKWMEEVAKMESNLKSIQSSLKSPSKSELSFLRFVPYKIRTLLETLLFRTSVYKIVNNLFY